jgi:hypothetical protein
LERRLLSVLAVAEETKSMITWTQFGAYISLAISLFAGGVGVCWFVLWRQ